MDISDISPVGISYISSGFFFIKFVSCHAANLCCWLYLRSLLPLSESTSYRPLLIRNITRNLSGSRHCGRVRCDLLLFMSAGIVSTGAQCDKLIQFFRRGRNHTGIGPHDTDCIFEHLGCFLDIAQIMCNRLPCIHMSQFLCFVKHHFNKGIITVSLVSQRVTAV
ncbi:Uncharacterised protein [Klebsiella pneumoniae]|nr:Uncharacterised protein [Klebsiella pneumoniae]SLR78243.1 Uncharacterised protein [Klebsiella pneumoniae]SLS53313.1 Uncharacterised protein [Klebsiella pneumoniae]